MSKLHPPSANDLKIIAVIPAYKVKDQILKVVSSFGPEVSNINVVDDACPDGSGQVVLEGSRDPRVTVLFHAVNLGVGGAVKTGYRHALTLGDSVVIKIDGDGQMDSDRIEQLVKPIFKEGVAYTKGNRFFELETIKRMPKLRIFGNLCLSFMTKVSTGYWQIFDPNNGFTAIKSSALRLLPLEKIDNGYFF
jgi:glycosyltransferase involved in cell wall biosynthesis